MSLFWFERFKDVAPNHLISAEPKDFPIQAQNDPDLAGRSMLVQRLTMMPIECVVRGYLVGSGWKDYQATGSVCGHALPAGHAAGREAAQAAVHPGHQGHGRARHQHRSAPTGKILVGDDRFDEIERISIELYEAAADYAATRGIIIADTKFEFGLDNRTNQLVLGDEVLTPDSSRFWPADSYQVGTSPQSFDKQYVRDWLETLDWNKQAPGPEVPADVVAGTQQALRRGLRRDHRRIVRRLPDRAWA